MKHRKKRKPLGTVVDKPHGVIRRFTMATDDDKQASADGRIDTGADRTTVDPDVVCRLDAVKQTLGRIEAQLPGGAILVGFEFPVTVRVQHRTARIRAFAPLYYETTVEDKETGDALVRRTSARQEGNLLGEDFMRAASGKLDYGKPGREFSGALPGLGPLTFVPATPEHARLADYYMRRMCRPKKRKKPSTKNKR